MATWSPDAPTPEEIEDFERMRREALARTAPPGPAAPTGPAGPLTPNQPPVETNMQPTGAPAGPAGPLTPNPPPVETNMQPTGIPRSGAPPAPTPAMSPADNPMGPLLTPPPVDTNWHPYGKPVPALSPLSNTPEPGPVPALPDQQGPQPEIMSDPGPMVADLPQPTTGGPAPQDDYPEPEEPNALAPLLGGLGRAAVGVAGVAGGGPTSYGFNQALAENNRAIQAIGQRHQAAKDKYQDTLRKLAERRKADKLQAEDRSLRMEDRSRKHAREDAADQLSQEARDPNSAKNQTFRQIIESQYPDIRKQIPDDQWESLTLEDLGPSVNMALKALQEKAKLGERGQEMADKKELIDYRASAKYRNRPKGRGAVGRTIGTQAGFNEAKAAMAETFGGEDKIPPILKTRLSQAANIGDHGERFKAINDTLKAALSHANTLFNQENQAATQDRLGKKADATLARDFTKDTKRFRDVASQAERAFKVLAKYEGEDVPGVGLVAGMVPDWAHGLNAEMRGDADSKAALEFRNAKRILSDDVLREKTGAAVNMTEQEKIDITTGAKDRATKTEVLTGLKAFNDWARRNIRAFSVGKEEEARQVLEASGQTEFIESDAGPPGSEGPTRPGKYEWHGTAEEAEAAGYEVLGTGDSGLLEVRVK